MPKSPASFADACALGMAGSFRRSICFWGFCAEHELARESSRKRARKGRREGGTCHLSWRRRAFRFAQRWPPNADAPMHTRLAITDSARKAHYGRAVAAARFRLRIAADAQRRIRQCRGNTGSSVSKASIGMRRHSQHITAGARQKREAGSACWSQSLQCSAPFHTPAWQPFATLRFARPLLIPCPRPLPFSPPHTHTHTRFSPHSPFAWQVHCNPSLSSLYQSLPPTSPSSAHFISTFPPAFPPPPPLNS